jgi:hypothetical protein
MIRREVGDEFLLIAQHDHALLAGKLAEHYGNTRFAPPDPKLLTQRAVALHDCGWPLHDDAPTLNKNGLPLDVFESPIPLAVKVWGESVERVACEPDYTQLLVSLHVLGLSAFAATNKHSRPDEFELNRFQHAQIERQEALRKRLGLSVDIPLRLGMAVATNIPREEQLRRNHLILQAMDRLSLALCCTEPPFARIEHIVPKIGAAPVSLVFTRVAATTIRVEPWPFDRTSITLPIACRAVPAMTYTPEAFYQAWAQAPVGELQLTVQS